MVREDPRRGGLTGLAGFDESQFTTGAGQSTPFP
jgi:hypothetical protein